MSEDIYNIEIEQVLEQWEGGEIGLVEAFEMLCDLGHDPVEVRGMLKTNDPDVWKEQNEQHHGELAGMA